MHLDKSPFVVISVIGQELLAAGHFSAAVTVLEAALQVGTCSLKLRGSVFSALSSAYWALNSLDKAIDYMQKDLAITKSLGECKADIFTSNDVSCIPFVQLTSLFVSLCRRCRWRMQSPRKLGIGILFKG